MVQQIEAAALSGDDFRGMSATSASLGIQDPAVERLADVPMRVQALLGRLTMTLGAIAAVEAGTILVLDRSAGDSVDVSVNDVQLASGEIVVLKDTLGVRITNFVPANHPRAGTAGLP